MKERKERGFVCFEWVFQNGYAEVERRDSCAFPAARPVWLVPAHRPTNQPRENQLTGGAQHSVQLSRVQCVRKWW